MNTGKINPSSLPFFSVFVVLGLLGSLWALASPLISVPDEQAHVIKAAAVVRGQLQTNSGAVQGEQAQVSVPAYIAATDALPDCFAHKAAIPAGCSPVLPRDTTMVKALTTAGNYNPMYYAAAGLPSLFLSGAEAIYAMRIVGVLLTTAFMTSAVISLAGLRQWRLPVFVGFVALTPMVLFLSGSVNPNALEIATSMAVFCGLCLAWERVEKNDPWKFPLAVAALSAIVLVNTRPASLLWLALDVLASLILFGWRPLMLVLRNRFGWAMAGAVAIGCLLSLLWLMTANSFKSLTGGGINATPIEVVSLMLDRTFDYAASYVSVLGWLDTPGPAGVLAIWSALIIGALLIALSVADVQGRLAVEFLAVGLFILPPILQIPLVQDVGIIWQGRYILALAVVLIVACGIAMRSFSPGDDGVGRKASAVVLGVMVIGHFYSFNHGLRRYVLGIPEATGWTASAPQWQPPLSWFALSALYLAVLIVGAVLLHRWVNTGKQQIQGVEPPTVLVHAH